MHTQVEDGQAFPSHSGDVEYAIVSDAFGVGLAVGYEHFFDVGDILS
jgi:hypothetical protein